MTESNREIFIKYRATESLDNYKKCLSIFLEIFPQYFEYGTSAVDNHILPQTCKLVYSELLDNVTFISLARCSEKQLFLFFGEAMLPHNRRTTILSSFPKAELITPEMKKTVNTFYADDFEILGYAHD